MPEGIFTPSYRDRRLAGTDHSPSPWQGLSIHHSHAAAGELGSHQGLLTGMPLPGRERAVGEEADPELILLCCSSPPVTVTDTVTVQPASGMSPCPCSDIGFAMNGRSSASFLPLPSHISAHSVLLDSGIGSSSLSSPTCCCFNNQKDGKTKPFTVYC